MRRSSWVFMVAALAACEGQLGSPGADLEAERGPPPDLSCTPSQYAGVRLQAIVDAYAATVHPQVVAEESGCVGCHGAGSGRMLIVGADATDSFYQLRAASWFKDQPGSFVSRLTNADPRTRMPLGKPAWTKEQIEAVAHVSCLIEGFEQAGGAAADEQFPPQLLFAWDGGANPDGDFPFINFLQLKAKVAAVFGDDWRRAAALPDGGVGAMEDRFDKNIGLFGGVNFRSHFVEARAVTPEFLLGLDQLAPDVCGRASAMGSGPFTGLDVAGSIVDVPAETTAAFEAETVAISNKANVGYPTTNPVGFFCYTNCELAANFDAPAPGDYRVTVRALADNDNGGNGPKIDVRLGVVQAAMPLTFTDESQYVEQSVTLRLTTAGRQAVSVSYINDYNNPAVAGGDRNVAIDRFRIVGPLGAGTGTARATTAKASIATLAQRVLLRPATAPEQDDLYALLKDLTLLGGTQRDAWNGVCEALLRHPDFLFTVPPSYASASGAARQRLMAIGLTQHLLGRPPTAAEFTLLDSRGYPALVDAVLSSPDFERYYFTRVQLRLESQGTPESDEPARLWTHVVAKRLPLSRILDADFTVDAAGVEKPRPAEHGKTGVLTMKGYLSNKPGLPHYNFPARVLSGFLGSVFEVPPEVFDQRGTSTATSTVDPQSACFTCHQLLTPLAHQRLKWGDDGVYRTVDEQGQPLDDTDHGLVKDYPYKGSGLEAFTTKAIRKEAFIRRMIAMQFRLLMGREARYTEDERDLYRQLWDVTTTTQGDLKAVIKHIALSPTFTRGGP